MKVGIIDDERDSRTTLRNFIREYTTELKLVGEASSVREAIALIRESTPDLLFLDIQLTDGLGFDLLRQLGEMDIHLPLVIFVTAYDEFALQAFQVNAIDYLLKPVNPLELIKAVNKFKTYHRNASPQQLQQLLQNVQEGKINKLCIPSQKEYVFVDFEEIIRCESDVNYTRIFVANGQKYIVPTALKYYESMLPADLFFRISQSHLVNLSYVKRFVREDGGYVELSDGTELSVSRGKRQDLLKRFWHVKNR